VDHIKGQYEPKQDAPLESHVSTAILVTDDDDEDDERNQKNREKDDGQGSEFKKQNKTEEVPLKANNIFSSLVDRSELLIYHNSYYCFKPLPWNYLTRDIRSQTIGKRAETDGELRKGSARALLYPLRASTRQDYEARWRSEKTSRATKRKVRITGA